jgi:hypothetical protein
LGDRGGPGGLLLGRSGHACDAPPGAQAPPPLGCKVKGAACRGPARAPTKPSKRPQNSPNPAETAETAAAAPGRALCAPPRAARRWPSCAATGWRPLGCGTAARPRGAGARAGGVGQGASGPRVRGSGGSSLPAAQRAGSEAAAEDCPGEPAQPCVGSPIGAAAVADGRRRPAAACAHVAWPRSLSPRRCSPPRRFPRCSGAPRSTIRREPPSSSETPRAAFSWEPLSMQWLNMVVRDVSDHSLTVARRSGDADGARCLRARARVRVCVCVCVCACVCVCVCVCV